MWVISCHMCVGLKTVLSQLSDRARGGAVPRGGHSVFWLCSVRFFRSSKNSVLKNWKPFGASKYQKPKPKLSVCSVRFIGGTEQHRNVYSSRWSLRACCSTCWQPLARVLCSCRWPMCCPPLLLLACMREEVRHLLAHAAVHLLAAAAAGPRDACAALGRSLGRPLAHALAHAPRRLLARAA